MVLLTMSYDDLISKFIDGFGVIGVYLTKGGTVLELGQGKSDPRGLIIIRRHISDIISDGEFNIEEDGENVGIISNNLENDAHLLVIVEQEKLADISKHWKRFFPTISKKINVEEIISSESKESKVIQVIEAIEKNFDTIFQDKGGLEVE